MQPSALQTLLDRRPAFLSFVQRRVDDRALAEDILQAAYMRALQSNATPPASEESKVAWFYAVLRNAVIDNFRRRATETAALNRWKQEFGEEEPVVLGPPGRDFPCRCIEKVLPQLRPPYAALLREVDLGEKPLNEFAREHDLTPGNAAVRAHRARAALRRKLAEWCGACSTQSCLRCSCPAD